MLGDFVYEVYEKAGDRQCCLVNLDLLQVLDWPTDSRDGFVWLLRHTQHLCCELRKWRRRSKQKQGRLRDVEGARQRARVRKVRLKQVHKQLGFKQLPAVAVQGETSQFFETGSRNSNMAGRSFRSVVFESLLVKTRYIGELFETARPEPQNLVVWCFRMLERRKS